MPFQGTARRGRSAAARPRRDKADNPRNKDGTRAGAYTSGNAGFKLSNPSSSASPFTWEPSGTDWPDPYDTLHYRMYHTSASPRRRSHSAKFAALAARTIPDKLCRASCYQHLLQIRAETRAGGTSSLLDGRKWPDDLAWSEFSFDSSELKSVCDKQDDLGKAIQEDPKEQLGLQAQLPPDTQPPSPRQVDEMITRNVLSQDLLAVYNAFKTLDVIAAAPPTFRKNKKTMKLAEQFRSRPDSTAETAILSRGAGSSIKRESGGLGRRGVVEKQRKERKEKTRFRQLTHRSRVERMMLLLYVVGYEVQAPLSSRYCPGFGSWRSKGISTETPERWWALHTLACACADGLAGALQTALAVVLIIWAHPARSDSEHFTYTSAAVLPLRYPSFLDNWVRGLSYRWAAMGWIVGKEHLDQPDGAHDTHLFGSHRCLDTHKNIVLTSASNKALTPLRQCTQEEGAIRIHKETLEMHGPPHSHQGSCFKNLARVVQRWFQTRFKQWDDPKNSDKVITLLTEAEMHVSPHPDQGSTCNNLANAIWTQFEQHENPKDIDEAIMLYREALEIHAALHPNWSSSVNNLANAVWTQFEQCSDPKDIATSRGLSPTLASPKPTPPQLIPLKKVRLAGFKGPVPWAAKSPKSRVAGLDSVLRLIYAEVYPSRGCLNPINISLMVGGGMWYLEGLSPLKLSRLSLFLLSQWAGLEPEALDICAAPHPNRGTSLNSLAIAVGIRSEQCGDPKDIDEAFSLLREALEIHAAPHPNWGQSLNNLANAVKTRFEQRSDPKDIDEAIMLHREALEIHAAPHPNWGHSLNNLANAVKTCFEQHGDPKDIDEAIILHREALEIHAAPHPNRSSSLNNLAIAVQTWFEQHGDPNDIDEAIMLHRESLKLCAAPHPNRGHSLNNLANALQTQFEQCGDPKDIDEAIMPHREALEIRAAPHPNRSSSLNNLANVVQTRFEQRGDPKDIDEAIMLHREALDIHAAPHPNWGYSLNNLANSVQTRTFMRLLCCTEALEIRATPNPNRGNSLNNLANAIQTLFELYSDPKDIDEAIMLHREALEIRATPHPNWGSSLNNLANAVKTRFEQRGDPKDIDEAIMLHREALEIRAAPHPNQGHSLNNLANAVWTQFEQCGDPKDIDEAIMLHREALEIYAAPHPDRGHSLNNLANAVQTRFEQCGDPKDIYEAIFLHRQASTYIYSSALICFSASHQWIMSATRHGHGSVIDAYRTAINLLPQLAAFSLDLKSRQQMLARENIVSLASAAATCAIGLNQNNLAVELLEASRSIFWAQALHLRTPVDKLEDVQPELATKLRHLSQKLEQACFRDTSQTIFKNNQHQLRSIEAVAAQCHQLNEAWDETVSALRNVPGFEDFLQPKTIASLQQAAVSGPIIILLANDSACSALIVKFSEDVQHVPLPALNLQMLQQHYADLPRALSVRNFNVKDFLENVNSDHQSDLAARLFGAQEDRVDMSPNDIFHRLLADIWQTIVKPVFEVLKLKVQRWSLKNQEQGSQPMAHYPGEHYSRHNFKNPLNSGLILSDGHLDIAQIMRIPVNDQTHMMKNSMKLAFLSACETAKGDAKTPDEAMHLAASLLFAGFGGVIATMWTMNDNDGPKIADTFYEYLFQDCSPDPVSPRVPDLSKAAKALHFAVKALYREPGMTFERWIFLAISVQKQWECSGTTLFHLEYFEVLHSLNKQFLRVVGANGGSQCSGFSVNSTVNSSLTSWRTRAFGVEPLAAVSVSERRRFPTFHVLSHGGSVRALFIYRIPSLESFQNHCQT
ncbi:hypothetical protein C8J57DRAFT_1668673 [Mycena rebaudengoi]|nr:hypothetical protein C8J57DRAFT_1668673 [Mycena rebaudengoi]